MNSYFGLIVIGDEILYGDRADRHHAQFRSLLKKYGKLLHRCWFIPDQRESLVKHLQFSISEQLPVFVCGGIGATPDDLTRSCAAEAFDTPLQRHPEAKLLIESQFGEAAYPTRIKMADLPMGCDLIPNPYNQIPGFSISYHHFLPGFPEMAWPMAEWVLRQKYPQQESRFKQRSLLVLNTPESALVPLMERINLEYQDLKMYSLPKFGTQGHIELGLRGDGDIDGAFEQLQQQLTKQKITFQISP
ncbi:MAG: molybdopterin-binding protein [Candidatus Thiodiazotropha lotti]|uniref:Molybdopterin-binding protein n=1 Tax=Candidatus Thiodiazotropha lotti TaxID=2792787 RepID=A0A9E4K2Z7_9GAMM|nr:molybdopterin-binding protein [Candidatus Thiodiazotropha lotti]MCW4202501.1 molybdopterin-binding protein [Candidatus Thiodiazotropha lotti]